jgi:hypothetical protein
MTGTSFSENERSGWKYEPWKSVRLRQDVFGVLISAAMIDRWLVCGDDAVLLALTLSPALARLPVAAAAAAILAQAGPIVVRLEVFSG